MKMVMFHIYVSSQDGNPDGKNPFLGTWDVPSRSCMEPPAAHLLHGSSMFFTVFRTSFIDAKKCQEGETIEFLQNGARRCGTLVMKRPGKHRETPGPTMERPGNRPWNSMVAPGAGIRGSDGGDSKPASLGE